MRFHASIPFILVLGLAAGCGGAPTTPAPVTFSSSVAALSLERTATATITATLNQSGESDDVTATSAWTTSNALVATVSAGLVTAVGPGTATISAANGGRTVAIPVTVRRRVYLRGQVEAQDVLARGSVRVVVAYVDGLYSNTGAMSGWSSRTCVLFGSQSSAPRLPPGDHELTVQLDNRMLGDYTLFFSSPADAGLSSPADFVEVRDKDTGELVDTLSVPTRTETLSLNARVTWRFTIKAYTS